MPPLRVYRLFISHAWDYSDEYNRMVSLLNNAPNFLWHNYSVTKYDPLHCQSSELTEQIREQIRPVQAVLILSGMYAAHSSWIQFEIDYSVSLNKPIIGIRPYGNERVPACVNNVAIEMVGWNTDSVVDAVRRLAS